MKYAWSVFVAVSVASLVSAAVKTPAEMCTKPKPVVWSRGSRHVQHLPEGVREKVLNCFGTSDAEAKKHDDTLDALRNQALAAILPSADKNKLAEEACMILMAPYDSTSDITKKQALVTSCIWREVETLGMDSSKLDMKAIQVKCIKSAFPDVDEAAAMKSYAELVTKSEKLEAEALRVTYELAAAMRFTMDEGPTKDVNTAAREECLKTLSLEIEVGDYLSQVTEEFKKGNLDSKKKIDACTYKTSLIGKWVRERQMLLRECVLEAQKTLPENLQSDLKVLYALQFNTTALETFLSCSEREEYTIIDGPTGPSGAVDVYCTIHAKAPKECQHCAGQVYTTVDASRVEKEVDSCYIKKEAVNPLYKQYAAYLEKVAKRNHAIDNCLVDAVGAEGASRFKVDTMKAKARTIFKKQATQKG